MVIVGPLVSPEDGLVKKLENVTMKINQIQMNAGILYVTEKWVKKTFANFTETIDIRGGLISHWSNSYLRWQENGREEGLSIAWQDVTLHAISNNPVKCIYLMLDQSCEYPSGANNGNGNGNGRLEDDDDDEGTCEGECVDISVIFILCGW